jgi:hypothetical protein
MGCLVLTYREQGQWKEAESLGLRVMEVTIRVLGPEHPEHVEEYGLPGVYLLVPRTVEGGRITGSSSDGGKH